MNVKDIVKNIKTLLSVDITLEAYKTTDGLIIEIKSLTEGEVAFEVSDNGAVPLTAGEYTLEDGTVIQVGEQGIITSIIAGEEKEPVEPPQQPQIPAPVEEESAVEDEDLSAQMAEFRTELDALKAEHVEVLKTLEILSTSLSDKLFKTEVKQSLKKTEEKKEEKVIERKPLTSNKNLMTPSFMSLLEKVTEISNKK